MRGWAPGATTRQRPPATGSCCSKPSRARWPPVRPLVVSFTVPANALGTADDGSVLGLGAEILVDGMLVASGGEAFATSTAPAPNPTSLAIVYPLTVPAESSGLFTPEQLEEWTAPLGLLDRQLDAIAGKQVAVGIDPRLIASIRVLGTAAPASATQWLARLGALTNETFPLAYADADVALQAQLELPGLLTPTTFSDVLDPAAFADAQQPVDPGAETPTPTPTAPANGEATPSRPIPPIPRANCRRPRRSSPGRTPAPTSRGPPTTPSPPATSATSTRQGSRPRSSPPATSPPSTAASMPRRPSKTRPRSSPTPGSPLRCARRRPRRRRPNGAPLPGGCSPNSPSTPSPVVPRRCSRPSIAARTRTPTGSPTRSTR